MVLFTLVLGNEMFLLSTYLLTFKEQLFLPYFLILGLDLCFGLGTALFMAKKVMSVIQLISASEQLAELDIEERQIRRDEKAKAGLK